METKVLKNISLFTLMLVLTACPKLDPCFNNGHDKVIANGITISPLQSNYSIGDEVIISFTLSSHQIFSDGLDIEIYQATNIENEIIESTELHKIIEDNNLTIIEGNYLNYKPYLSYYSNEDEYRFKLRVRFNKIGNYSLFANADIIFKEHKNECNEVYSIETNILGMNTNRKIEFVVQ